MTGTLNSSGEPDELTDRARARSWGRSALVAVRFRVDAREGIERVSLVGDFNDWSRDLNPLRRHGDRFTTTVQLANGQRHRYQFVIDGNRWENDWRADDYEETASGAFVSVVDLRTDHGSRAVVTGRGGS